MPVSVYQRSNPSSEPAVTPPTPKKAYIFYHIFSFDVVLHLLAIFWPCFGQREPPMKTLPREAVSDCHEFILEKTDFSKTYCTRGRESHAMKAIFRPHNNNVKSTMRKVRISRNKQTLPYTPTPSRAQETQWRRKEPLREKS